jgi:hypothetical protein
MAWVITAYDIAMQMRRMFRRGALVGVAAMLAACGTLDPVPAPSESGAAASASPSLTASPSPTPVVPVEFPLAVVTGITNLKPAITVDELVALAGAGELTLPCGVTVDEPTLDTTAACTGADEIAAVLQADQARVALLPPGLVEPATKVLRIAGDGPFGLFGPDLFGDPEARALPYPVTGSAMPGDPTFDVAWAAHDASDIWTLTNLGSLCADRGAAHQTVTLGKGWHWAFNGGTAEYSGPAEVDQPDPPPFPPQGSQYPVNPIETGNEGVTSAIVKRSDVAIADHECPIMPDAQWQPATGASVSLSVPEAIIQEWQETLGIDVLYLAANHLSDRGNGGIQSTLDLLDAYGMPQTGLGMDLDQALEPVFVEVAGQTVGVVAFNDVPGSTVAAPGTPGVAWITQENINAGVGRARDGGADLVICAPQWWGGAEYHDDMWPVQVEQLGWFDAAGCDHVIGSGTHVAGPLLVRRDADGWNAVLVSPGNYMFGQGWWQETQEGVILDLAFRGTDLVNVRLHPTVQILQARPALLDPEGDGSYVLERIWKYATVDAPG